MAERDFQPFPVIAENFSLYVNWPSETVIIHEMTEISSHYAKWLISHIDCNIYIQVYTKLVDMFSRYFFWDG